MSLTDRFCCRKNLLGPKPPFGIRLSGDLWWWQFGHGLPSTNETWDMDGCPQAPNGLPTPDQMRPINYIGFVRSPAPASSYSTVCSAVLRFSLGARSLYGLFRP